MHARFEHLAELLGDYSFRRLERSAPKTLPQFPELSTKGLFDAEPVQEEDASSDPWELQFLALAQSS